MTTYISNTHKEHTNYAYHTHTVSNWNQFYIY